MCVPNIPMTTTSSEPKRDENDIYLRDNGKIYRGSSLLSMTATKTHIKFGCHNVEIKALEHALKKQKEAFLEKEERVLQ